jgi:hypothetical protein
MGYKTTSAERSQASSAISSAIAAFNNPDGSGFALTSTALTEGVELKQYTVVAGTDPISSEATIGGGATITAVAITDSNYTVLDDTAVATTGGYIKLTGSGFKTGCVVYVAGTAASTTTFVSSTEVRAEIGAMASNTHTIYLLNTDGSAAFYLSGLAASGVPTWSTEATLPAAYEQAVSYSQSLTATGDATITYSLKAGSNLPTGVTLNSSTGALSGTTPADTGSTTYTFTIIASDGQNQDTERLFSLTVNTDTVTWTSPGAGTASELAFGVAMGNVSLVATAASGRAVTYTANTLPTGVSLTGDTIFGTPTVDNESTSTLLTATNSIRSATRVVSWVVVVAADTYFKNTSLLLTGETLTPTWLDDASDNNLVVTNRSDFRTNASVIPTARTPYNKTTYPTAGSAWFAGESPDGPGAYDTLLFQMPAVGNVFTVEFWFYADEASPGLTATKYFLYSNSGFNIGIIGNRGLGAGTSGTAFQTATGVFSAYTWNHVAVVRTGTGAGEMKMYLNGTLVTLSSGAFTGTHTLGSAEARIGGTTNGYQNLLRGNIADFRIVDGTAVYTGNFAAPTVPLTAISGTVFLSLQYKQGTTNSGFVDDSTNGFPIIRYGNPTQGTFSPFSPTGWSAYYDGSGDYATTSGFGLPTNFTVEFWTYFTLQPTGGYLTSASSSGPIIGVEGAKTILGWNGGWLLNPPNDSAVYPNGVAPLNQWNHWAVVRNSGTMTFYLNGIKLGSAGGVTNDATASQTWGIGSSNDGQAVNVPFYMSNFRMSSVARYSGTNTTVANFTLPTADFVSDASTLFLTHQSNRFKDSGPNNQTVVTAGDIKTFAFSPFSPTVAYSAAVHGGSMYFDGAGDYLITPPGSGGSTALDTGAGTSDVTFECWVYNKGYSGSQYGRGIVTFYPNGGYSNSRFMFRMHNGGDQINIFLYISGTVHINTVSTALATPNAWTHLAFVRQSGTFKLYINGVLDFSSTGISASLNTFDKFEIGRNQDGSVPEFNGYISDFRYVKGTAVYTANFTPPTAPLTAISGTQLLLKGTDGGIVDRSGRNVIETVGYTTAEPGRRQPEIRTQVKKYGSSSIFFGGGSALDALFVPTNPALAFESGNFTVEFWVNFTSIANRQDLVWWVPDNDSLRGGISWRLSGDALCYYDAAVGGAINTAWLPTINTWYHIALSRSGSSTRLFIDGVAGTTYSTILPYAASYRLFIGKDSDSDSYPFTGYMDDFRITKGVARYTTTFTPPTTFLLK